MTRLPLLATICALSVVWSIRSAPAQIMARPIIPTGGMGLGPVGGIGSHLGATPLGGSGLSAGSAPGAMNLTPTNLSGSLQGYSTPTVNSPQGLNTGSAPVRETNHREQAPSSIASTVRSSSNPTDAAAEAQAAVARGVAMHPTGGSPPKDKDKDDDDKQGNNWWLWLLLVAAVIVINSLRNKRS